MVLGLLRVFHRHVEANVVNAMYLHLVVYCSCHYVAWREREAWVIFLHELRSVGQLEHGSISTHGLGDEEGRVSLGWVVEHGGVKLHELHVLNRGLGAIGHRYAVASGYFRVRRGGIHGSGAASGHERDTREIRVNLLCLWVDDIGTIALYVWRAACHLLPKVVLGYYLYGKMVFKHRYVWIFAHGFHQSALNLEACVVFVVENPEL